jgi:hypothetical protein
MTVPPVRCSDAARARGDLVIGTASPATRWLLLEQESGWQADVQASVQAPPAALAALERALAPASARLELIRRPHARGDGQPARWCVVDTRLGVEAWGVRDADGGWGGALDALADPLAHGAAPGAGLLLVCTHGRHDQCCAVRGRPVVAALAEAWPGPTWECTHLGGDRFAANVAVLPDGVLYGYVSGEDAVALVDGHRAGRVDRAKIRGVIGWAAHEQAAIVAAAEHLGTTPWDRAITIGRRSAPEGWHVQVVLAGRSVDVFGHNELAPPARLTCSAPGPRSALVPVVDSVVPATRR